MNLNHPVGKVSFAAITLAVGWAFAGGAHADTNLILNGDFSANAADYTTYPGYNADGSNPGTPTDWSAGAGGIGTYGLSPFDPSSASIDGTGNTVTDFAFLQKNYASISQSFDVTAGQEYDLSYVAGARSNETGDEIIATLSYASDPTDVLVDSTNAVSNAGFTSFSSDFTADATGEVTLTFAPEKSGDPRDDYSTDFTVDVTNVAVEAVGSVPEPSVWAMLGAGAVLLFGFLRLRRSA